MYTTRDGPIYQHIGLIDRYLGFADTSISAKTANFISLSRCWQNAVIFLMYPDNLLNKASQDSYLAAMLAGALSKSSRQDEPWTTHRPSQPKQEHHH